MHACISGSGMLLGPQGHQGAQGAQGPHGLPGPGLTKNSGNTYAPLGGPT